MTNPDLPFAIMLGLGENDTSLYDAIKANAKYAMQMVDGVGSKWGQKLVICGSGPSAHGLVNESPRWLADEVWACNAAVPFLMERGVPVTHAVAIDQTPGMLDDWKRPYPELDYWVASSIHPRLRDHLLQAGCRLTWFHNFLGIKSPDGWTGGPHCWWCAHLPEGHAPAAEIGHEYQPMTYESYLYRTLFPQSLMPPYGLNVTARALSLALCLGYTEIRLWGSDCGAIAPSRMPPADDPGYAAWLESVVIHASGRTALDIYGPTAAMLESPRICGRQWITRPDMVMTAHQLALMIQWIPGRVRIMGDSLPGDLVTEGLDSFTGSRALPKVEDGAVTGMILHPETTARLQLEAVSK